MYFTAALALAGAVSAQNESGKSTVRRSGPGTAAIRGKAIFAKKCAACHNSDSTATRVGPGLKGIAKRGTFTANNSKVTDNSLKTWIENGDSLMPPFKQSLEPAQIKDVIAYLKTL